MTGPGGAQSREWWTISNMVATVAAGVAGSVLYHQLDGAFLIVAVLVYAVIASVWWLETHAGVDRRFVPATAISIGHTTWVVLGALLELGRVPNMLSVPAFIELVVAGGLLLWIFRSKSVVALACLLAFEGAGADGAVGPRRSTGTIEELHHRARRAARCRHRRLPLGHCGPAPAIAGLAVLSRAALLAACLVGLADAARAETWRTHMELIQDWSIFTCSPARKDRIWHLELDGAQLRASGPEGNSFTATLTARGSFKADFLATYSHPGTDRVDKSLIHVTGNLGSDWWVHFHVIRFDCWYRMVRLPAN